MTLGTHERPINPQTAIQAWYTGTQDQFLPQGIGGPASSGVRQIGSGSKDSGANLYSLTNRDFPLRFQMDEHVDRQVRRRPVQPQTLGIRPQLIFNTFII